ncbi:MAG: hypothetical protein ABIJ16_09950 [Bacteroidota bacterium]
MKKQILLITAGLVSLAITAQTDNCGMPWNGNNHNQPVSSVRTATENPVIIHSIPAPVSLIGDIAWDGQYIYAGGYAEYQIYKVDPVTGTVAGTIPTDVKRPYGLTYDGTDLWIVDNDTKEIKKVRIDDGTILDTIFISTCPTTYPTGLTWDGSKLWFNDPNGTTSAATGDMTRNIDVMGSVLSEYQAYGDYPSGMAFDGVYLWSADNFEQLIHQIDPATFTIVRSIIAPGGSYPNGLAWDGEYLWVANNASDSIYQLNVGNPTSLGTVADLTDKAVLIYPNPVTDKCNILTGFDGNVVPEMTICNSLGQVIYNDNLPVIDGSAALFMWNGCDGSGSIVPVGSYYCSVKTNEQIITKVIIRM